MTYLDQVTTVTIAGAFVVGMILVLLNSIRTLLIDRLHLSEGRVEWLLSALNLSLIPMMLLSGMLVDKVGVRGVLIVGSLITCVAIFDLSMSQSGTGVLGAVLMAGAGAACLSTGSIVLMSTAFYPGFEAASQNMGNVFFALGALLTPALVGQLTGRLGYRRSLALVAVVCLLPALFAALTRAESFDIALKPGDLTSVFRDPFLWLAGLAFFLYGPLEASLGMWGARYLKDQGLSERRSAWVLSGFWLAFLGARLISALILARDTPLTGVFESWLIVLAALGAGVALGNLAGTHTRSGAVFGVLLLGVFYGPIFPTLVSALFQHFPEDRGTAYGSMFAIGATGNLLLQPLIGSYARRRSVQRSMRVPMVMALVLALVALILLLVR